MRSATITATAHPIAQQGDSLQATFQETDIAVPGHEAVTGIVNLRPAQRQADIATVVKCSDTWSPARWYSNRKDGVAPRLLNVGDTFMIPANVTHTHTNRGQSAAHVCHYIIDKSEAVTTPVR